MAKKLKIKRGAKKKNPASSVKTLLARFFLVFLVVFLAILCFLSSLGQQMGRSDGGARSAPGSARNRSILMEKPSQIVPKSHIQIAFKRDAQIVLKNQAKNGKKLARSWSKAGQELAKSWPETGQKLARNWPKAGQKLARNEPKSAQKVFKTGSLQKRGCQKRHFHKHFPISGRDFDCPKYPPP